MSIENHENNKPEAVIIPFEKTKKGLESLMEGLPENIKERAQEIIKQIIELEKAFNKAETREEKELIKAEFTHVHDAIQSLMLS